MLLRLVMVRHAEPENDGYADETLRPLTSEGKSTQMLVNKFLGDQGVSPSHILSSPILRAVETAHLISEHFGSLQVKIVNGLGYEFDVDEIFSLLPHPQENQTIYIVGHMPSIAEFTNALVGEVVLPLGMEQSSVAIVDFRDPPNAGNGHFMAYYTPQLIS